MINFISILIILLVLTLIYFYKSKSETIDNFECNKSDMKGYLQFQEKVLNKCQVPSINTSQCFLSEWYKCPKYNGSYQQCTNNYMSLDKICECENIRAFEVCPHPYKISEKCYQENISKRETPRPKIRRNPPCNPRINKWHADVYNPLINNCPVYY